MKRYIKFIAIIALLSLMASCKEDKIEVFGNEHFIHFTKPAKDTIRLSFATIPGEKETTIKIPVSVIGRTLAQDEPYTVSSVTTEKLHTTADTTNFEIPNNCFVHKATFQDTIRLRIINSEALSKEKLIVLEIKPNSFFKLGPYENQRAYIYISNIISKPNWWKGDIESNLLGPYSDIKYRTFIKATGISDITNLSPETLSTYITSFVNYLLSLENKGTIIYEKDGQTKLISTIPFAKKV